MNSAPPTQQSRQSSSPTYKAEPGDSRHQDVPSLTSLPPHPVTPRCPARLTAQAQSWGGWAGGGVASLRACAEFQLQLLWGKMMPRLGSRAAGREEARTAHAQTEHPRQKQKRARAPHVLRAQLPGICPCRDSRRAWPGWRGLI